MGRFAVLLKAPTGLWRDSTLLVVAGAWLPCRLASVGPSGNGLFGLFACLVFFLRIGVWKAGGKKAAGRHRTGRLGGAGWAYGEVGCLRTRQTRKVSSHAQSPAGAEHRMS